MTVDFEVIGNRPAGVCQPDDSHLWAERRLEDGVWTFTTYNGWLATSTTTTDTVTMANLLTVWLKGHYA